MSVLGKASILRRLKATRNPLVVTPLLVEEQVGDSSLDVRLGNEFLLPVRATRGQLQFREKPGDYPELFRRMRREFRKPLFIHPHQLVLGATLEYIKLPEDLSCYVIGRSSLGRTGLIIATATAVAPGFRGCVTLEIVNIGELPLPIYPGMRIAQLVFHKTVGAGAYSGRFACATGPQPPMLERDKEMEVWLASGEE